MIPQIEKESPQQIKLFQEEKLRHQLQYVYAQSPFYRQFYDERKIDIERIKTLEDLKLLPCTTKDDLQTHNEAFLCVDKSDIVDWASTSGTTGQPVNFGLTDADLNRLAYNEALSFACAGVGKEDVVQLMTTLDRQFMAGLAYFLGLRKLGAGVIRTGAGIPALQWEAILKYRPDYLVAVPSFLLKLIDYAQQNNIDVNKSGVKAAICIGEPLRLPDFSPSALTRRIRRQWNIKLLSTYASTEMSTAFTECEHRQGGHLHPELIIPEVINEQGQPVTSGEIGELVITTLGVKGLPLVRFKTGDMLSVHHAACPCGRQTLRLGPVIGRAKQMIKYKGTTLFPPAIHEVLNGFEEISGHIIELSTNALGTDEVTVKIVSKSTSHNFVQKLKEQFQAKIRVVPKLVFINNKALRDILKKDNSRKPKWVTDKR